MQFLKSFIKSLIHKLFPNTLENLIEKRLLKNLPYDFQNSLKRLNKDSVCIDLGANIGLISSILAKTGATVYSFEPNSIAYMQLEERKLNFPNIIPIKKAAGVIDREVKLYHHVDSENNANEDLTQSSSLVQDKPNTSDAIYEVVDEIDFAKFLNDLDRVDLIKIDIEGFEVELINHLVSNSNLENISKIYVETHYRKWPELKEPTLNMIQNVENMNLSDKFDFTWI